jgi:hypothetical protein
MNQTGPETNYYLVATTSASAAHRIIASCQTKEDRVQEAWKRVV